MTKKQEQEIRAARDEAKERLKSSPDLRKVLKKKITKKLRKVAEE